MLCPFSPKSLEFIRRSPKDDAFITILEGEVRSGKTWTMMVKLLALIAEGYETDGLRVIFGQTKQTVYDNVLIDLFSFLQPTEYQFHKQSGELWLFGQEWRVIGAKDEGSEKFVRGKTIGIGYGDEATLVPASFMNMLTSRMSDERARLYLTTNPDTPFHYLKTDFIDDVAKREKRYVEVIHFTMDDNLSLTPEVRRRYEEMYTGVFYLRFIKGLWVIAEGAILRDSLGTQCEYDDASRPVSLLTSFAARYILVDYGTTNPCVFLDVYDDGRAFWQEREYYWDSAKMMRQKTDEEYADDLLKFIDGEKTEGEAFEPRGIGQMGRRGVLVIVDPSAASFKVEMHKRGIQTKDAKNEVIEGIRRLASALKLGLYRIHKHNNPRTQKENGTYSWDPKKALRGEEEPIKSNDHTCDAERYGVHTMMSKHRLP